MADNVAIPPTGTGDATPSVATDDVAGDHYQKMKLADGTADSATMVAVGSGAAANALRVTQANDDINTVSTNNSTTGTLGISGVFTGTGEDVSQYAAATVMLDASHDSAVDGMTFQFSTDNTNWDDVNAFSYVAADGARRFQFPVTGQYFRVVYTNGGTGQTHFRMQTILHRHPVRTSVHRVGDVVSEDRSVEVVKAVADSLVSSDNSRAAAVLNGGSTWTGAWEDVHRFALLTVLIDTGTSGKTGTLKLQFSMDGSTLHRDIQLSNVDPDTESPHTVIPVAQYFRVEYVADGTSPADDLVNFTVQTLLQSSKSKGLTSRVTSTIDDNTDVDISRAVLTGKTGGGSYVNVGVTTGGNIKVDNEEIAGTAVDVNTGNASAGTQRVVLATDQPAVTVDLGANNDVQGDVAHDTADSGNPVKLGAKAESSLEGATMVADGDRTDVHADVDGQLMVKPHVPYGDILSERVSDTGGTSTAFSTFNAQASVRNYVTTIIAHNASATDGYVDIRDGTAGSVLMTIPLPANGGAVINLPVPLRQPTANTALAYDVSAALTTVYISLVGFQSAV